MPSHIDYSDGLIPWETVQGEPLLPYTCHDGDGNLVQITPKYPGAHTSWEAIQSDPAYHYNLGYIVLHPEEVEVSLSQNPQAIQHRLEGEVVNLARFGFISSINAPASPQFPTDKTVVTIKYTATGNYSLTSQVLRAWR